MIYIPATRCGPLSPKKRTVSCKEEHAVIIRTNYGLIRILKDQMRFYYGYFIRGKILSMHKTSPRIKSPFTVITYSNTNLYWLIRMHHNVYGLNPYLIRELSPWMSASPNERRKLYPSIWLLFFHWLWLTVYLCLNRLFVTGE